MSDIIAELRACGTDLAESAANEIERCHARLEIDHCFRMGPEPNLEMIRQNVPFEKRTTFPDAVRCRDATIAVIEEDLATLCTRLAEVEAENERLREIGRKASVALSLVMSLDFDDDADQWADARMKCDNAAASLRDALAQNKESSHDG